MSDVATAPRGGLAHRLYHGETAFDFVGRKTLWFAVSGIVILIGVISLLTQGLNYGIDFKGGTSWQVPVSKQVSVSDARSALRPLGLGEAKIQTLNASSGRQLRVEFKHQDQDKQAKVTAALAKLGNTTTNRVSRDDVGPSWGKAVTRKARTALICFFIAVTIYISLRFEWKMAIAAIVAVIHDILVTVGVYSVVRFEVTPATVVAFLTILGYSLYDTVVVFDKVQENTRGLSASGRMTYAETVNLSMNQVLMRSINTSLVAIMPVLSVLLIGAYALGATALEDFALALLVGLLTGAYSSIFVASPLLAVLKEREPRYASIRQRVLSKGSTAPLTPAAAAAMAGGGGGGGGGSTLRPGGQREAASDDGGSSGQPGKSGGRARTVPANRPRPGGRPAPRPRKKGKRR